MTYINKMGIGSATQLAKIEEQISKIKAIQIFDKKLLDGCQPGSLAALLFIHGYLFNDIYLFAGRIREVNIFRGGFRFVPAVYLQVALQNISNMPQDDFEEIVDKFVEMNIAHPFRDGNGRSTRIWLDDMLKKELNMVIDWSKISKTRLYPAYVPKFRCIAQDCRNDCCHDWNIFFSKKDYLTAMEHSSVKDTDIKLLLREALTDKVDDRELYLRCIDYSFMYEDFECFRAADLDKQQGEFTYSQLSK